MIRGPRQLNLSDSLKKKLADGWRLDIWEAQSEEDYDQDPAASLKGEAKRIILKRRRLSADASFERWHGCMAGCWRAILFSTDSPALRLLISTRAREAGESIYLNSVLLPLLDMAASKKA